MRGVLRRSTAWLAAVAVVAGGAVVVTGGLAEAAPGPNPYTDLRVTKTYDGTGHGTAAATFVNTANGFVPGDDIAADGVVASGDVVGYEVELKFQSGPKRTIAVAIGSAGYLSWLEGKAEFCAPVPGVSVQLSGDTCLFTIEEGAAASLTRTLRMTARDTAGSAMSGQQLKVSVGLQSQQAYGEVIADPVTVVSAPQADLTIRPNSPLYAHEATATGGFTITPRALQREGFSPTKGVSASAMWEARVNVSAFPASTIWKLGTQTVTPVNGWLTLKYSGERQLNFTVPGGWPAQAEGSTIAYDVAMEVPSTAFKSNDYLNNGDGWQPGTGKPKEWSSYDPKRGSIAGTPYPNNDYSAARVYRPIPPVGELVSKRVAFPRSWSQSKFEPGNMLWAAAEGTGYSNAGNPEPLAPGAQFRQDLAVLTTQIAAGDGGSSPVVVIADEWDPKLQRVDGIVNVTGPSGSPVDPASYRLFWSTTAAGEAIADAAATSGWVEQEDAPAGARAIRVVFAEGALPVGAAAGAGVFTVSVPAKIRESVKAGDGPVVQDVMRLGVGSAVAGSMTGAVQLVFPVTPILQIEHTVASPQTPPGSPAAFTVKTRVVNPPIPSKGFAARVEVQLDRCVAEPVNTSPVWAMTVTPAAPGPSGRVCGDPESTPAMLVFTPAAGLMAGSYQDWNKTAALPDITYTVRASFTARDTIVSAAEFSLDDAEQVLPVGAEARTAVPAQLTAAAKVAVLTPQEEIGQPLRWRVDLAATVSGSGFTETVVVLPRVGDGTAYASQVPNWTASPKTSSFSGSRVLTEATFNTEDTTVGAELFFTVTANPTLNPGDPNSVWHPVAQAGQGGVPALAGATALKVRQPANGAGANAALLVTVLPTGNAQNNNYLLWAGKTITGTGTEAAPVPWPARAQVVMASVSGTVWKDVNNDATQQGTEPTVQGATIGLFKSVNGVVESTPVRTAVTNTSGGYSFGGLTSGDYVTGVVTRGPNLPAQLTSYYGQQLPVDPTFSFANRRFSTATERSTVFTLALGGSQSSVNFGFHAPEPKVDLDKSEASLNCNDTTGVCDVAWQLTLTNLGNAPVSGGTLTDTASVEVYGVEAVFGSIGEPIAEVIPRGPWGAYALSKSGKVYSWGEGNSGQNGNGAYRDNLTAELVQGLPAEITDIYGSTYGHGGLALDENGRVWSWGSGYRGRNGNGSEEDSLIAQLVQGLPAGITEVVEREGRGGYALAGNGQVWAWGDGSNGGNGNGRPSWGNNDNLSAELVVDLPAGIKEVVPRTDGFGAYAVGGDGRVWSWGAGDYGSNGNGTIDDSLTAELVQGLPTTITEVVDRHGYGGYALSGEGRVWAWGRGENGANGNGANADNYTAQLVQGLPAGVKMVVDRHAEGGYVLGEDGRAWAWGRGAFGANGNGGQNDNLTAVLVQGLPAQVTRVSGREAGGYAIVADGRLFSWGAGDKGANGNGSSNHNLEAKPVQGLNGRIVAVEVGGDSDNGVARALTAEGTVFAWGMGSGGASGNGKNCTIYDRSCDNLVAEPVQGLPQTIAGVMTRTNLGGYALGSDGSVFSWGAGSQGANGNGSTANNVTAQPVKFPVVEGDTAVPPSATTPLTDGARSFAERAYPLPSVPAGEKLSVVVRGKVNQGAAARNVLNQAWFTSPSTPYAGIAKNAAAGRVKPILPADPGASPNPAGIPGNPSCDTTVDGQNQTTPDSCDQVPVRVPIAKTTPGGLQGVVWADANRDGQMGAPAAEPRAVGIAVALYSSAGAKLGEAVTDADGAYRFTNVPPGSGYTVEFAVLGVQPSQAILDTVLGTGKTPAGYSYGITAQAAGCTTNASCASPANSRSRAVAVLAGTTTDYVNAGLVLDTAKLTITKTSDLGDPAVLPPLANGTSSPLTVKLRFTNTGVEPLGKLKLSDLTATGRPLTSLACTNPNTGAALTLGDPIRAAGVEFVLAPGQAVDCTGTLPSLSPSDGYGPMHRNVATISGKGAETGQLVEASDAFEAAIGTPAWTLAKSAKTANGDPLPNGATVRPGDTITYVLTATNTGKVTLDGLVVSDDASQLLNSAKLQGALPAGVTRAGSTLSWKVPPVAPGASESVEYSVSVKSDAYAVPLVNLASGDGIVPPQLCAKANPCRTEHRTPDWFAFGLPVLGGNAALSYTIWGGLILAAAFAATVLRRRRSARRE